MHRRYRAPARFEQARLAFDSISSLRCLVPASLPSPQSDPRRRPKAPTSERLAADAANAKRRAGIGAWIAVLAWSGVIWQLGGDYFSAPETRSTLIEILTWLGIGLEPQTEIALLTVVRKAAHCVEYGILALLVSIAVRLSSIKPTRRWQEENRVWPSLSALGLVLALAIADETRQSWSVSRTGSPYDVLLDFAGGLIAIACLAGVARLKRTTTPPGCGDD